MRGICSRQVRYGRQLQINFSTSDVSLHTIRIELILTETKFSLILNQFKIFISDMFKPGTYIYTSLFQLLKNSFFFFFGISFKYAEYSKFQLVYNTQTPFNIILRGWDHYCNGFEIKLYNQS